METLTATKNNVQTIQEAFENFLQGNIAAVIESCTDDVEWGSYDNPEVPYGGTFKGKQGVLDFFTNLGSNVNYSVFEPRQFFPQGDDVVVLGRHEGTVKSTGKSFAHDWCFSFKLQNQKVKRFFAFVDTKDQAQAFKK